MTFTPPDIYGQLLLFAIAVILAVAWGHYAIRRSDTLHQAFLERMQFYAYLHNAMRAWYPMADAESVQVQKQLLADFNAVTLHAHRDAIMRGDNPRALYTPFVQSIWAEIDRLSPERHVRTEFGSIGPLTTTEADELEQLLKEDSQ